MSQNDPKPRWGAAQRLEFIDFRLYWEGRVNRADLVSFFGISVPQASADLSAYQAGTVGNIVYDKTAKAYVATAGFRPAYFSPSGDRYLAELRLLDAELLVLDDSWIARPPSHAIISPLRRRLESDTLRDIVASIRTSSSVEVRYQSFTRPEPTWRRLTPHALAFDGLRWHIRAWCHDHQQFRDFVIGRILQVREPRPDSIDPSTDLGWVTEITLQIGPHPKLQEGAKSVTELDYGMKDGVVEVTTRACLVPYLRKRLGLEKDVEVVSPQEQHIVLLNRTDVENALKGCGISFGVQQSG